MFAYVTGTTRVKGVQNKEVWYVGQVEDDGYIYFNDDLSYRVPTPSNLAEHTDVNLTDVQIWYPNRQCWIRANYFNNLKVYGVDPKQIYSRIDSLESRMTALENRVTAVENRVTSLEGRMTTLEGAFNTLNANLGTFYNDIVLANGFDTLTEYLMDWRSDYDVIAGYLGEFWNALNLYAYDASGNTITYATLTNWMGAVKEMLRLSSTAERTNANNISTNATNIAANTTAIGTERARIDTLTAQLGSFYIDIVTPSVYSDLNHWLQGEAALIRDTRTTLGDISTMLQSAIYNPTGATDLAGWCRVMRVAVNTLNNRFNDFDPDTLYTAGTIEAELAQVIHNFNSLYADLFGSTGKFIDIANEFSALEHQALGTTYSGEFGNGYTLLMLLREWNNFVEIYTHQAIGTPSKISLGAWTQYGSHSR